MYSMCLSFLLYNGELYAMHSVHIFKDRTGICNWGAKLTISLFNFETSINILIMYLWTKIYNHVTMN